MVPKRPINKNIGRFGELPAVPLNGFYLQLARRLLFLLGKWLHVGRIIEVGLAYWQGFD
jgi:hypothetical protein